MNGAPETERFALELDTMVIKAFRIVTRAVKFLDVWDETLQSFAASSNESDVPPTPPADRSEFGGAEKLDNFDSDATRHYATANTNNVREPVEHTTRPHYHRASKTYVRPGSSNSCKQSRNLSSRQGTRDYVSHRVSCVVHPGSQNLASEKLGVFHNTFLTTLGYFIGLHLHSRPTSESLLTTKQAVLACRDMLDLAGEIWERDHRRSKLLEEARDNMYKKIAELADAARVVFRPLRSEEDDVLLPSEGKPLMEAATACVRAAGVCVAESRIVIDRIGDFDFAPLGLGLSDLDAASAPSASAEQPTPERPLSMAPPPPYNPSQQQRPIASIMLTEPSTKEAPAPHDAPTEQAANSVTIKRSSTEMLLPPLPALGGSLLNQDDYCPSPQFSINSTTQSVDSTAQSINSSGRPSINSTGESHSETGSRSRKDSIGVSSAGDSSAYVGSVRDSEASAMSQTSTRATSPTSPDGTYLSTQRIQSTTTSFTSSSRTVDGESEEIEASILERTFANELAYNKDGQITGGTLPALIERLTTPDATPDATFVSTFFLTFRLFASSVEFAEALIDRYNYVRDSPRISGPVRLRVYNVFKGWLESHWRNDCDKEALELINAFATRQLQIVLPTAGKRLASLAAQVTDVNGPLVPRLISSIGKTNTSCVAALPAEVAVPPKSISKSQYNALRNWKHGGANVSIVDLDALELARQLTLKESQIFCSILPEELLGCEWTKQSGSMAVNVRAMSRLSTDLANLVADDILQCEDPKKRGNIIKQWVKIATELLKLSNYHSLMAIVCSLTQSTIMRLKKTWDCVSTKTKVSLEKLKKFIQHDRNYASLRQTFQNQVPPCVPWVGLYLTDLTFVDAGNQTTRQIPGIGLEESKSVINFDKHMKTAKIISELQRFQVPYRLQECPELQTWLQDQLVRVRTADQSEVVQNLYRRSLLLEPRVAESQTAPTFGQKFLLGKDRGSITPTVMSTVI